MEFQLEQLLEQQINLNENYYGLLPQSISNKKHSSGRPSQPADEINYYTPQESAPAPEENNVEVDVLCMSDSHHYGGGIVKASASKAEKYQPYCSNDNAMNVSANVQDGKENAYDDVDQLHEERIMPYSAAIISNRLPKQQQPHFSFQNSPGAKRAGEEAHGGISSLIKSMSRSQLKNTNSQSMSQPQNRKVAAARGPNHHVALQQQQQLQDVHCHQV